MAWSIWKRGACRPGNLDDFIDTGNYYVPPHITDETDDTVTTLQEQHAADGAIERAVTSAAELVRDASEGGSGTSRGGVRTTEGRVRAIQN